MIPATASSTSAALSRLAASSAVKAVSNPASRVESVIAIAGLCRRRCRRLLPRRGGRLTDRLDPIADLVGPRLQPRAVDNQPRTDIGDVLNLDQPVGLEGRAG